ncbi:hypothetical protein FOL47_009794 [Perkinsus chesapeaki]|uniref:Uncharacterized protein n=1 Tax=Perkinsus chesapeaki TaxID=330153 RepID=A0A7J6L6A3_PERCH|nr:hypothetical protein FOL47_009794 [Perkinsus chesapeaki]
MPTPTLHDAGLAQGELTGKPRSVIETVKLAASRLAEVRRHQQAFTPVIAREDPDGSIARIRSELQNVHERRRLERLQAEQRQANNDFSGIDEGVPITQVMREDLVRGTEGDQRLKEWLDKYVNSSQSSSVTTS